MTEERRETISEVVDIELKTREDEVSIQVNEEKRDDYSRQLRQRISGKSTFTSTLEDERTKLQPATVCWSNICYSVPPKRKKPGKNILTNINGIVKPGQLLAIMGSSGAGKTSLLNVLARRVEKGGVITGDIRINGVDTLNKNKKYLKTMSGYVMQDDTLLAHLTVRETLFFSASMRLPSTISVAEKKERVEFIIRELGLVKCADSRIGSVERRGISGGERKRVNIGIELITNPSLLFLDEPTSGLDAFTSYSIMETMLSLAEAGRTVICTIHQPRSNIFNLFDLLMLLSQGQVVYFGPAKNAVEYFSRLNFKCPQYVNPADFFLDAVSIDQRDEQLAKETEANANRCIEFYKNSDEAKSQLATIEKEKTRNTDDVKVQSNGFAANYFTQLHLLFQRSIRNFYRDKLTFFIRLFQTLLFSIIIGLIYLRIDNDQSSIMDRGGVLFFIIINQAFNSVIGALTAFDAEKLVFIRERSSRTYRVSPYYISKSLAELPGQLLFPFMFSCIVYWMVGLNPSPDRFFIFIGITLLLAFTCSSIGLTIGALAPNPTVANVISPIFIIVFMLFGGFYINLENIPVYFVWLEYTSFVKYAFVAYMVNEFQGLELRCKDSQIVQPGNVCPIPDGDAALKGFDMDQYSLSLACGALIAIAAVFKIGGYFALRYVTKKL